MPTAEVAIVWACAVALVACQSQPATEHSFSWRPEVAPDEVPNSTDASHLLDGFDVADPTLPLRVGDRALIGVRRWRGDEVRNWFVLVKAYTLGDARGDQPMLHAEIFDAEHQQLSEVYAKITGYLPDGIADACRAALDPDPPPARGFAPGQPAGPKARGTFCLMDLLRVVVHSNELAAVLWDVIDRPSLLSLLGGVEVSAGMSFRHARPITDPSLEAPGYAFPLVLRVNGTDALHCEVTVVEPASPLRVCGGVTQIVGHAPDDPTRRVVLRLLAARRARR